jgi:hypothetical protein
MAANSSAGISRPIETILGDGPIEAEGEQAGRYIAMSINRAGAERSKRTRHPVAMCSYVQCERGAPVINAE